MKRTLQLVGGILLLSPIIALILRFGADLLQPDGMSLAVRLLFRSRMIIMFGWFPFAIGIAIICIGTFAVKQEQSNP
jgi:hypothetical protein